MESGDLLSMPVTELCVPPPPSDGHAASQRVSMFNITPPSSDDDRDDDDGADSGPTMSSNGEAILPLPCTESSLSSAASLPSTALPSTSLPSTSLPSASLPSTECTAALGTSMLPPAWDDGDEAVPPEPEDDPPFLTDMSSTASYAEMSFASLPAPPSYPTADTISIPPDFDDPFRSPSVDSTPSLHLSIDSPPVFDASEDLLDFGSTSPMTAPTDDEMQPQWSAASFTAKSAPSLPSTSLPSTSLPSTSLPSTSLPSSSIPPSSASFASAPGAAHAQPRAGAAAASAPVLPRANQSYQVPYDKFRQACYHSHLPPINYSSPVVESQPAASPHGPPPPVSRSSKPPLMASPGADASAAATGESERARLERLSKSMRAEIQIKNRYYLLKMHENCFLGKEAVDWLTKNFHARNREEAVFLGQLMMDHGFFRHPADAHRFKDKDIFYRFREDEKGAFGGGPSVAAAMSSGKAIHSGKLFKKGMLKWYSKLAVLHPPTSCLYFYDTSHDLVPKELIRVDQTLYVKPSKADKSGCVTFDIASAEDTWTLAASSQAEYEEWVRALELVGVIRRTVSVVSAKSIWEFQALGADGSVVPLSTYKRRVVIIVNTASQCALAKTNFVQLQQLYAKYGPQGLCVLAFPCNQFGLETGNAQQVAHAVSKLGVTFPVFAKTRVVGSEADPIFQFLTNRVGGLGGILSIASSIKWNFTKFLVDRSGVPRKRYGPNMTPSEMEADIVQLLHEAPAESTAK